MQFLEYTFSPIDSDSDAEILIAFLDDLGYEGYVLEDGTLKAYITAQNKDENALQLLLEQHPAFADHISFHATEVPEKNWNEIWESTFQPIEVDNRVRIRASFHSENSSFPYEIIIDPKMSFGTGHHSTTRLMVKAMLQLEFKNMQVLDMGCGTGLLAILAKQMGAARVTAMDIDQWAVRNCQENAFRNHCPDLEILKGEIQDIKQDEFDILLANINRNVLLNSLVYYSHLMNKNATLLLSGIMENDSEYLKTEASKNGFVFQRQTSELGWVCMKFVKK